jgi:vancomycin resistance protein YoaR
LSSQELDLQKVKLKINEIARKVNRNPQDSVFIVQNGVVSEFTPSIDGVTVNETLLTNEIENNLNKLISEDLKSIDISIPVVKLEPKIKNEDINNLGIKELIGKGVSYYKGSIPNRIYNVNLAQSKFKGVLVPPNEIFSFNQILGDVSGLTGYKSAYVIKDGKTVLGDGGGVCQVSSTLFRAVLSAGLPVIERKPHSYRVGYYEQGFAPGLDATVFFPSADFKFKNDTDNYILIQPTNDSKNLTLIFEIYGTNDGRMATTTKPIITSSIKPADDLYIDDPTLPTGTVKQIEHRAYGARVVFDYKVTRNGEELINQKFVSNYRPWQAVYLRGVGI